MGMTKEETRRRGMVTPYAFEQWLIHEQGFLPETAMLYADSHFREVGDSYFCEFNHKTLYGDLGKKSKYPSFKVTGYPTPNDTLYVCDTCGYTVWAPYLGGSNSTRHCGSGHRMRLGNDAETAEATKAIKTVIGDKTHV